MSRRLRPALVAALASALLAGCSGATDTDDVTSGAPESAAAPEPRSARPLTYVALGDSYTAAPLVPAIDGGSGLCVRSTRNYPALVAESLRSDGRRVRLRDRSCVESRTPDLFAAQYLTSQGVDGAERDGRVPPQTRPLDRRTDLVTVGIGGNDVLTSVIGTCPAVRDDDPTGAPCAAALGSGPSDRLEDLRSDLAAALRRIARRAPRAEILVVGYPQTAPPSGTCPARLPLAAGDVAFARTVADDLDAALRSAAGDAGAGFVDAYAASAGHDICADEPWVNGSDTDPGAALAYHPFASGQEAVAALVLDAVTGGRGVSDASPETR